MDDTKWKYIGHIPSTNVTEYACQACDNRLYVPEGKQSEFPPCEQCHPAPSVGEKEETK